MMVDAAAKTGCELKTWNDPRASIPTQFNATHLPPAVNRAVVACDNDIRDVDAVDKARVAWAADNKEKYGSRAIRQPLHSTTKPTVSRRAVATTTQH